jgi:CRISPR-associated protein Cmr2
LSQQYLISIAIGPVQEFIEAARKTRDLYVGSRLLSEASKACALYLVREWGAQLIFPFANSDQDLMSGSDFVVANKILAQWTGENPKAVASGCKGRLNRWLLDEFEPLKINVDGRVTTYVPSAAKAQLAEIFEFYAAWKAVTPETYHKDRAEVESILSARKNLRNFGFHKGANLPKSSLDGNRETVITHDKDLDMQKFAVRKDEFLDGLGVFKRFWRKKECRFDSTHDVAARPYVAALPPDRVAAYRADLKAIESDKEVRFSFSHLYHLDKDLKKDIAVHRQVQEAVARLKKGSSNPQPAYYGVFLGDGDFMGKAISGIASIEDHQKFSQALSKFAGAATRLLENGGGPDDMDAAEPVFAGGDDVLAFLPLHKALEYMIGVRRAFQEAMVGFKDVVSFSAGLAVCHALDPLTLARKYAKDAEKAAKAVRGKGEQRDKDAFAITVVPRSGAEVSFAAKWDDSFQLLQSVARLYCLDKLTLSLAHEYRKLLSEWPEWLDEERTQRNPLDEHLRAMALAIARKKDSKEEAVEVTEKFFSQLATPRENLTNLTNCLYVARPFARAMREAGRCS